MSTINISTYNVSDILRKEAFRRAKPTQFHGVDGDSPLTRVEYNYVSQDDFIREFEPSSHNINSIKEYPNLLFANGGSVGKWRAKMRTRVAVAWQKRIHTKRTIALTGYEPDITSTRSKSDKDSQQLLADFKEGWAIKGMDTAIHLAIKSDLKVGDVAICAYKYQGNFGYRIFSFDRGDTLYPHFDPMTGRLALFGRKFSREILNENGQKVPVSFLDVWDETSYMQYRESYGTDGEKGWAISQEPRLHSFPFCPIAYHRYGEPCWAGSQSLIEQHEMAMSQLAENNAQYALRILYTLGGEFEMEGSTDGTPTLINSSDANSKVGFLEPADSSSSFELQLKSLEKEIMRCSFAVESPELKSGSDVSSLTVKTLMADSYLKALDDAKEYQGFLDDVVYLFTEGYGTEVGKRVEFFNLNIQIRLQPWTFMAESEVVNTLVQLTSVGILSRQSATEYAYETLGLGSLDEAERVLQQEHDKLVGEALAKNASTQNIISQVRNDNR